MRAYISEILKLYGKLAFDMISEKELIELAMMVQEYTKASLKCQNCPDSALVLVCQNLPKIAGLAVSFYEWFWHELEGYGFAFFEEKAPEVLRKLAAEYSALPLIEKLINMGVTYDFFAVLGEKDRNILMFDKCFCEIQKSYGDDALLKIAIDNCIQVIHAGGFELGEDLNDITPDVIEEILNMLRKGVFRGYWEFLYVVERAKEGEDPWDALKELRQEERL